MRRIAAKLVIGVAIAAIGMFAADSSVGTWKYNAAKSKVSNYPIKSQIDVREATPDGGVKVTRTGQFTDGTPNAGTYSYKYDGKESSTTTATGLPFDKISVKRIDANTTSWEVRKIGGKYHATGQNVISPDGKTLTQTSTGKGTDGKPTSTTLVFDRQ